MTQPAKVQEPSMEEILASIRRIIADDEAKPPLAEKPAGAAAPAKPEKMGAAAPAAKAPAMNDIPPSAVAATQPTATQPAAAKAPPPVIAPAPPPVASRCPTARTISTRCWQGSTKRRPRPRYVRPSLTARCSNSPTRWRCRIRRHRHSTRSIRRTISNLPRPRPPGRCTGSPRSNRRLLKVPPLRRRTADSVALDRLRGRIRLQHPCQHRAQQQRADAGRPGQGNAAADAEILARRQFARIGRAHREGRNRAGFPRPLTSRFPRRVCWP